VSATIQNFNQALKKSEVFIKIENYGGQFENRFEAKFISLKSHFLQTQGGIELMLFISCLYSAIVVLHDNHMEMI